VLVEVNPANGALLYTNFYDTSGPIDEYRGIATDGIDLFAVGTTTISVQLTNDAGGVAPQTKIFDAGVSNGVLTITYDFFGIPDNIRIYYPTNAAVSIFDVTTNGSGTFVVPFSGTETFVRLVMNETGGNAGTAWNWQLSVPEKKILLNQFRPTRYFLPEESLYNFVGERSIGRWQLEVTDNRVGATNPPPQLIDWSLNLTYGGTNAPVAVIPRGGGCTNLTVTYSNTVYILVNVPLSASWATNTFITTNQFILMANRNGLLLALQTTVTRRFQHRLELPLPISSWPIRLPLVLMPGLRNHRKTRPCSPARAITLQSATRTRLIQATPFLSVLVSTKQRRCLYPFRR